jgi:hypothetical protein
MPSPTEADPEWQNWKFLYDPRVWSIIDQSTQSRLLMLEHSFEIPKNGVCHICQKNFNLWSTAIRHCDYTLEWIELDLDSHPSLLSCRAASNRGCKICTILLRGRKDLNDRDEDTEARELLRTLEIIDEPMTVKFSWSHIFGEEYWELGFSSCKLVYENSKVCPGDSITDLDLK